ncbi:MAG: NAD(P)-dependent dehydrogenase (short-subunit alcohol dehydrogenase family) [Phenylobacterium sp.]|jgi:NAD(P)-dependent dehydrogenase (short-subunit alcohol dehydrogenase family)
MTIKTLFSIEGKVAIVTGGSRGIGEMIAQGLIESGVKTYITARNEAELNQTAAALTALSESGSNLQGVQCIPVVADLSTMAGISQFADVIKSSESHIDILINNAGAAWGEKFEDFAEAGWDKVMNLNAKAPFFVIQQLLDLLKASGSKQDPARVINIASINALSHPRMNNYSYAASKAAVVQMTRHLAGDLVKDHININAIAPGFFLSKMTKFAVENQDEATFAKKMVPMERLGNADDIAGSVIYLCSRASAWVTGHTLVLDGGVIASSGYGDYGGFV